MNSNNSSTTLFAFIRSFILPTVIGKSLILYFGIHYSNYPGEGYGYGLVASIVFTVGGLGMLVWKYRDHTDL